VRIWERKSWHCVWFCVFKVSGVNHIVPEKGEGDLTSLFHNYVCLVFYGDSDIQMFRLCFIISLCCSNKYDVI
jgi:hypothetical protein